MSMWVERAGMQGRGEVEGTRRTSWTLGTAEERNGYGKRAD